MVSDDTIPTRGEKRLNDADWWNVIKDALSGDLLPRNASGVATDLAGSLGTETFQFLKALIASGHWVPGDIKVIHPYNGDALPGQGWMLCDGRTINESNYDIEHGAGSWDIYVGSSVLDGKKLPGMTNRYAVGVDATTQDGSGTITPVGNAGNVANLEHHHDFIRGINSATQSDIASSAGADNDVTINNSGTGKNGGVYTLSVVAGALRLALPGGGIAGSTSDSLSQTEDIRPDSVEVCFFMRVA